MTAATAERTTSEEVYGGLRIVRETSPNAAGAMRYYAKIWMGNAKQPDYYVMRTEKAREDYVNQRKASWDYAQNAKAERAAARRAFDATEHFAIGDILVSSWGYDQTNVDFYEVLSVTRGMVTIVDIGQTIIPGSEGFMSESVMPDPTITDGNVTRHRVTCASVRIEDYAHASKWDGKPKYQSHYA